MTRRRTIAVLIGSVLLPAPGSRLPAQDTTAGKAVYEKTCAQCHILFGKGAAVGPDLTASGRETLDQLLSNLLDPNLVIGKDYQARTVLTRSGQVLTGLLLEESAQRGLVTISSDELARRGGTTSAQVRKDLSFFGSFGKRGLGYSVPELTGSLREILGLRREWQVIIVGAGKIGTALAQYRGFRQRGFRVSAVYDRDPKKSADANRYSQITYLEALQRQLKVMDSTAFSLCMDNQMPIIVFDLFRPHNLKRVVLGEKVGTMVSG